MSRGVRPSSEPEPSPALGDLEPVDGPVKLVAGDLMADIIGGALLTVNSLRCDGVELLGDPSTLPASYRIHSERAGMTLLHPWANRLGADTFAFRDAEGRLDRAGDRLSRDGSGLAIHGLKAPSPWRLRSVGSATAVASLRWEREPGFPYPHEIVVRFELSSEAEGRAALAIETRVSALDGQSVPIAFGWHPYFRRDPAAEIDLPRLSWLDSDERGLPTGHEVPQEAMRITLAGHRFDDGVSRLSNGSQMVLHNVDRTITVRFGEGYSFGQVFAPADAPIVSFEPMTAPTDALRRGADLPVAEPKRPYMASFVVGIRSST